MNKTDQQSNSSNVSKIMPDIGNVKVIQTNVLYLIGIPLNIATEEILCSES